MVTEAQRAHLDKVTRMIPGYDPWSTAGDCWFDYDAAQQACDFFPDCLIHIKGEWAGKPIILEDWQQGVIGNAFGWKNPDGSRRYRECLLYIPRKNAKTTLAAGVALLLTFIDGEPGAEVYSGAANKDQAKVCHSIAKEMVKGCPALAKRAKIYTNSITYDAKNSFYQVVSSKGETKHGFNPHGAVLDELHAHKSPDLAEALTTAMGARRQPFTLYTTTADYARPSMCNRTHKYACDVRDGVIEDRSFLPVIYEAKPEDDWKDEATWRKANPNLGVSVKLDNIRKACQKAQDEPSEENSFKRLRLNIITEQADRWLQLDKWDACAGDLDTVQLIKSLEGQECFGGLDLSSTTDLTAFSLTFPPTVDRLKWAMLVWCWAPKMNAVAREKKDRVPYTLWARQGFLTLTEGNVIDFDAIRAEISDRLAKRFNIREIGIDRWASTQITNQLTGDGMTMVPFGQGFLSMSAPTKEFEKLVLGTHLLHGGNPLLRWAVSNVAIEHDAAENMKPSKKHSTERIDPVVATVMALGRAMARDLGGGSSVYDTRGIEDLSEDSE